MTIGTINLTQSIGQGNWRSTAKQARQDFDELLQAMQLSNLNGAQQAYGALQQLLPTNAATNPATTSTPAAATPAASATAATGTGVSAVVTDWSALGQALQSGDMTAAQDAFSKLQSDALSAAQGRHHHRHGSIEQAQAVQAAMQPAAATTGTVGTANSTVGSDIASLKNALKNGDTSSAQDLLARLEQDMRTAYQSWTSRRQGGFTPQTAVSSYQTAATAAV